MAGVFTEINAAVSLFALLGNSAMNRSASGRKRSSPFFPNQRISAERRVEVVACEHVLDDLADGGLLAVLHHRREDVDLQVVFRAPPQLLQRREGRRTWNPSELPDGVRPHGEHVILLDDGHEEPDGRLRSQSRDLLEHLGANRVGLALLLLVPRDQLLERRLRGERGGSEEQESTEGERSRGRRFAFEHCGSRGGRRQGGRRTAGGPWLQAAQRCR